MERRRSTAQLWVALLGLLQLGSGPAPGPDPGLHLEIDTGSFVLTARDLRGPVAGPELRVVLGSPAHPTPPGSFPLYHVVRNPGWTPGGLARLGGAQRVAPSPDGPMGVAKIPFARGGFALHGGAHPLLLGKPVSLGCVRTDDQALLSLLDWLSERGALGTTQRGEGEVRQAFLRPTRLAIR